jgi:hypothetical protein
MRGAIPPLPQYVFMAWCLVKHRDNFNLMELTTGSNALLLLPNKVRSYIIIVVIDFENVCRFCSTDNKCI